MKIINSLPSIINQEQRKNLINFILKQANLREIVWDNVIEEKIKDLENFQLKLTPYSGEFSEKKLINQMEDIFINLVAILKENDLVSDKLSIHEMIRKDEVNDLNNKNKNSMDNIVETTYGNRQIGIDLRNRRVELTPTNTHYFQPASISVNYYPAYLKYIDANKPDLTTLSSGTIQGFWAADIYTDIHTDVGAIVTFEYDTPIIFSNINIRTIGKYNSVINKLEYFDLSIDDWVELTIPAEYSKEFYINFENSYSTTKIRMDIRQPHYDYIWNETLNDAFMIEDYVISSRDLDVFRNDRVDKVLADQGLTLINRFAIDNKYKYEIGAYNIQVFKKTYNNADGIFRSKRFHYSGPINSVRIEPDDETPLTSTIDYKVFYFDSSSIDIDPDTETAIDKTFLKIEKFSNLQYNNLRLEYYPFVDANVGRNISVTVNSVGANRVDNFTYDSNYQFIQAGDSIYLNKFDSDDVITVQYWHKSPFIIIEGTLNTGSTGLSFTSPLIKSMKVFINGDRISDI